MVAPVIQFKYQSINNKNKKKNSEKRRGETSKLTSGTQTMKHRWAQGLVGLANGAAGGNATLENGSFDDDDDEAAIIQNKKTKKQELLQIDKRNSRQTCNNIYIQMEKYSPFQVYSDYLWI